MCKFEKVSVGDFHFKGRKKLFLFILKVQPIFMTLICVYLYSQRAWEIVQSYPFNWSTSNLYDI
jgi:hypothetical protein